ncbi:MAG: hypothetical protein IRY98_11710 [Alicyclobacillaceae bacterium]|nr:hypothetical protein [Alicyclobacillaceae bacterium]
MSNEPSCIQRFMREFLDFPVFRDDGSASEYTGSSPGFKSRCGKSRDLREGFFWRGVAFYTMSVETIREVVAVNVANCKRCGRIFQKTAGVTVCPACRREEEELYQKVRAYVAEHRGATIIEVSEATGVDADLVLQFLREGRLSVVNGGNMRYPCERCGREIQTGRFCERCVAELARGFAPLQQDKQENQGKFYTRPGWTMKKS